MKKLIQRIRQWWTVSTAETQTYRFFLTSVGDLIHNGAHISTPNMPGHYRENSVTPSKEYFVSNSAIAEGIKLKRRLPYLRSTVEYSVGDSRILLSFCMREFKKFFPVIPETLWVKEVEP